MKDCGIRSIRREDLDAVHALNESAVPHVNSVSIETLERFMKQAAYFRVVEARGAVAAFLLGFAPGAAYGSENYRWFSDHYAEFMYIDRIAVTPEQRGKGFALCLYLNIERFISAPVLACEVNLDPPNPRSLEFHRRFGFEQVGMQKTEGGRKTVILMTKPVGVEAN
ncbi:MAG: GNAT family N-acetyltransferase [Gammaproteobacteria bacterium]|nr:GNAT family N-acetyltransferase [Gammaproteobacteria bacterium]MDH3413120.1 GNAT family N-acetyltransferase [Gammaproteobacteria bacterium]